VRVLVAGASGHLGRELLAELRRRGHTTRALVRDEARLPAGAADEVAVADAAAGGPPLDAAVAGVDAVFSALGGPSRVDRGPRAPFHALDTVPNLNLLRAAEQAGVGRFAYVTILHADRMRDNAYADAHEQVVDALRASAVDATIIRANGFFSAYDELLDLARKGRARLLGDPGARSNPIHDADLAAACADALESGVAEVAVGGPETLTRSEELELALAAAGRPGKVKRVPAPVAKLSAKALRPFDPRRAAMLDFLWTIASMDMVAPPHGERRLGEYLRAQSPSSRA
jgi:uncharacterized protein YbjT (DUF2867 family)